MSTKRVKFLHALCASTFSFFVLAGDAGWSSDETTDATKNATKDATKAPPGTTMGWRFTSKGTSLGRIEWNITPKAARLDSTLVCFLRTEKDKAPIMFSPTNRKFKRMSNGIASFTDSAALQFGIDRKKQKYTPWKLEGSDKKLGYDCKRYSRVCTNPDMDETYGSWLRENMWVGQVPLGKQQYALIKEFHKIYVNVMPAEGVPMLRTIDYKEYLLKTKRVTTNTVGKPIFEVTKIEHEPIKDSIFVIGKGYKEVADESAVVFSRSEN